MSKIVLDEGSEEFKEIADNWNSKAQECKNMQDFENLYTEIFGGYEHDYGTICYAISAMIRAAFHLCNNDEQGGVTGFQASCIMWLFIRKEFYSSNEMGLSIIDYDKLLYPQYEDYFEITLTQKMVDKLRKIALKKLRMDGHNMHPKVKAHLTKIVNGEIPFGLRVKEEE